MDQVAWGGSSLRCRWAKKGFGALRCGEGLHQRAPQIFPAALWLITRPIFSVPDACRDSVGAPLWLTLLFSTPRLRRPFLAPRNLTLAAFQGGTLPFNRGSRIVTTFASKAWGMLRLISRGGPALCNVAVTNACNAACDFCTFARGRVGARNLRWIDAEQFGRALDIVRKRDIRYIGKAQTRMRS
jgi:hypothetical protein